MKMKLYMSEKAKKIARMPKEELLAMVKEGRGPKPEEITDKVYALFNKGMPKIGPKGAKVIYTTNEGIHGCNLPAFFKLGLDNAWEVDLSPSKAYGFYTVGNGHEHRFAQLGGPAEDLRNTTNFDYDVEMNTGAMSAIYRRIQDWTVKANLDDPAILVGLFELYSKKGNKIAGNLLDNIFIIEAQETVPKRFVQQVRHLHYR